MRGSYWNVANHNRDINNLFIYHPLWNKIRLIALALNDNIPTDGLAIYNTFRVLRSDLEPDRQPDNIDQIPAMALDEQGQAVDPNTGLVLGIPL